MNKSTQTIIGWLLLIAGLVIIVWPLYSSFNIIKGGKNAPQLFEVPEVSSVEEASQTEQLVQKQMEQMLPFENIAKLLSLVGWTLLAGLFIFGGSKISTLGIRLIKK